MSVEIGPAGQNALLRDIVRQMAGKKIAVLGDPMLDYYHFGHVDRLSPEAPVPVFLEDDLDLRDGGAANVVQNLIGLGCQPLGIFPPAPWSMKHRYLVGSQHIFRQDKDRDHSLVDEAHGTRERQLDRFDALIISDYAKGYCTPARCQAWISLAHQRGKPVVVDPKGKSWEKYQGADWVCPNEHEMLEHYDSWSGALLHKRGAQGLAIIYPDREVEKLPAETRHVFDVTGAGDTVVATFAAALSTGANPTQAAELANIAASLVVGEVGTTPIHVRTLLEVIFP
jgi:D-beta-D-heptose 7-phosphate kinase/D-beta-D-heptose 1-phosphate adenosyltransferase